MATNPTTHTGDTSQLVQPTGTMPVDAIIVGSKWGAGGAGTSAQVTFSFPSAVGQFDARPGVPGNYHPDEPTQGGASKYLQGFSGFGDAEKQASREVLASWAVVANITFTEVPVSGVDAGALRFAYSSPAGLGATTYGVSGFPQDLAAAGDTWMNSGYSFPEGWAAGTQNFLTLLHEVGHAIGLKHPHDTGMDGTAGWPSTPAVLPKTGDDTLNEYSTQNLVMAYNDVPGLGSPVQADFAPTTPMRIDITAIQYLYGANMAFNAGDTVYTFVSTERYNQTLWDGGGTDTIRVDGSAAALISLLPGTWSRLGMPITYSERNGDLTVARPRPDLTDPRTVFIYDTVTIENAVGGGGNDLLVGNAVANRLQGGGGDDEIDGGAGIDTAVYAAARAGYTVAKSGAGWRVSSASEGSDAMINVERLLFADGGLAIDTGGDGHGAQIAQILRACFGSAFVQNPAVVGIGLTLLDGGMPYATLVQAAIGLPQFEQLAGSRSHSDVARFLYRNIVGADPDAAMLQALVGALDGGVFTQATLAVAACQIGINTGSAELVGIADTGLAFVLPG